jgi:hypothetical protein
VRRAAAHRRERVRDAAAAVVVGVDAEAGTGTERLTHRARRLLDEPGQTPAVRLAQHQRLGPAAHGGSERLERVAGIARVAVEEVLRVVDHAALFADEERHALLDHLEVVLERRAQHLGDVERPRLADRRLSGSSPASRLR